jgi:ubiquinone/menaquinone biosynthesis C-methylase UbiE
MSEEKRDKHAPTWALDNFIRRLLDNPDKYCTYVTSGQVVADLGCGPGYYTLPLAEAVGPEGRVYAVDSNEKAIQDLEEKANKRGYRNIEAHASSASDLNFIEDRSIDFILACGLLCTMAPQQHESAVNEMKRVLKPKGQMYLVVGRGPWSYVSREEWETILEGFIVERRGGDGFNPLAAVSLADRWAVVSIK